MLGITEAGQDVSFAEMARRQQRAAEVVAADPAVAAISSSIGAGLGGQTGNNGQLWITLKPFDERDRHGHAGDRPAPPEDRQDRRHRTFTSSPRRTSTSAAGCREPSISTRFRTPTSAELYQWAPKILDKLRSLPMLRDVATDQQVAGTTATLTIDRDRAARFGIQPQAIDDTLYDAFGQRQITQYFTQLNSYHLILEVPPGMQGDVNTLDRLYVKSQYRRGRPALDLRDRRYRPGRAAGRSRIRASSRR